MTPVMRDRPQRVATGPELAKAAWAMNKRNLQHDLWPYPWEFPTFDAVRVNADGSIVAPAAATQTLVASYTVQENFDFWLVAIAQLYSGSGFNIGSSDITWVLDVNIPIGVTVPQGYAIQGFQSTNIPYGTLIGGVQPYFLAKPELLKQDNVIRSKVTTTNNIPQGAPNYFISVFYGWLVPASK